MADEMDPVEALERAKGALDAHLAKAVAARVKPEHNVQPGRSRKKRAEVNTEGDAIEKQRGTQEAVPAVRAALATVAQEALAECSDDIAGRTEAGIAHRESAYATKKRRAASGERRTTPAMLNRQEQAYYLSLRGWSVRRISAELGCTPDTAECDILAERHRRSIEIEHRARQEKADSIALSQLIIDEALRTHFFYNDLLRRRKGAKITDRMLDTALNARERIDKILGIDAPTKVEIGVAKLVEALSSHGPEDDIEV